MHPAVALPRAWWFPDLQGYRTGEDAHRTYQRFPLDDQPAIDAAEDLGWLRVRPPLDEGIRGDDAVRPLTAPNLDALAPDLPIPPSLRRLASEADLQHVVRSVTGCYLDLADRLVPTATDGGFLLHVLADSQWVRHWLLYVDRGGSEAMITTSEPLGYVLEDGGEVVSGPDIVHLDGTSDLEVVADSFTEFLYRFWVENELWADLNLRLAHEYLGPRSRLRPWRPRRLRRGDPLVADYAHRLASRR